MRRIAKKLLLAAFGLLIGLIAAEAMLRVIASIEAQHTPKKAFKEAPGADGAVRMAVLGGSTSNGSPFTDAMGGPPGSGFNLLSVTRFLLERRYGCPAVEIDNYAGPNWSAQTTIDHYFERPGGKPDALVLYTGQNETTQYYSPNMVAPPALLAPLARLQTGSLLLRRLFTRQVVASDQRYTGKFFSDNVIPSYEREYNIGRFRRSVEGLIRHAAHEGIFLVVVIPQSNYLFPPTRSVYEGPTGRKAEALRLFKQAWRARHVDSQPDRAEALFEQLLQFCEFADLFFELGELHYSRGAYDTAMSYLRRARETDGFPICITPAYRQVLRELVNEYRVPHIDMDTVIRENFGRAVPDYTSFFDDCHFYAEVYLELSREVIRVMREDGFDKLSLPPKALAIAPEEWAESVGITPNAQLRALVWEAEYHVTQADYKFLKLSGLRQARDYLLRIKGNPMVTTPEALENDFATVEGMIRPEEERMRKWVRHEGPMPIGPSRADEPLEDFGGIADTESSQGDALMANDEWKLAVGHYRAALASAPDLVRARLNMGVALFNLREFDKAAQAFEKVLDLDPQNDDVRGFLGKTLIALNRFEEAVAHLREAARIAPDKDGVLVEYYRAASALAWRLATASDPSARDGARAVELAEEVCRAMRYNAFDALDVLAAAYAAAGRFEDAESTASRALELARQHDDPRADAIDRRLEEYKAGRPWREGE